MVYKESWSVNKKLHQPFSLRIISFTPLGAFKCLVLDDTIDNIVKSGTDGVYGTNEWKDRGVIFDEVVGFVGD